MSLVQSIVNAFEVPEHALQSLAGAQTRDDLAQYLHDIVSLLTDLHTRVTVLENGGATPALVKVAQVINDLSSALAVAQELVRTEPTSPRGQQAAVQIPVLQAQIAAATASVPQAAATPAPVSPVAQTLKNLMAPAPASQPAPVSPAQQFVNQTPVSPSN